MTIIAGETRVALVRARFDDIPDLDLGTAGYLLTGLDDLFAIHWLLEHPQSRTEISDAPSPVIHRVKLNSPLEVLLWASGGLGIAHQVVRLYVRVQMARGIKVKTDMVVEAGKLMLSDLPHEQAMESKIIAAVKRASETMAVLESFAIVDEDEVE